VTRLRYSRSARPPTLNTVRTQSSLNMSGPVQNMVVSLVLMQGTFLLTLHLFQKLMQPLPFRTLACVVARKIPFDDPQVLNYVRIAYVAAQAIILGTYFFVAQKVLVSSARSLRRLRAGLANRSSRRTTKQ
jgi:hypothetical protein